MLPLQHIATNRRDRYRTLQHIDITADGCDRNRTLQHIDITADGRDRYRTLQLMDTTADGRDRYRTLEHVDFTADGRTATDHCSIWILTPMDVTATKHHCYRYQRYSPPADYHNWMQTQKDCSFFSSLPLSRAVAIVAVALMSNNIRLH